MQDDLAKRRRQRQQNARKALQLLVERHQGTPVRWHCGCALRHNGAAPDLSGMNPVSRKGRPETIMARLLARIVATDCARCQPRGKEKRRLQREIAALQRREAAEGALVERTLEAQERAAALINRLVYMPKLARSAEVVFSDEIPQVLIVRPGAAPIGCSVRGAHLVWRPADISVLASETRWKVHGWRLKPNQTPARTLRRSTGYGAAQWHVYGDWQVEATRESVHLPPHYSTTNRRHPWRDLLGLSATKIQ